LVGIDNDETACELASVPLTSVDLGWQDIGYRGAKLLSEIIDGTTEPPESPVLIAPKSVITRRSSDMCMVENPDVSAAMAYIWANFRGSIKFDNIVDQTSVSRCVLYRLFKTHLGRSLGEEVTRKRLESAEDLLRNTKEKIRVVAEQSGFSSTVHLIRAFDKAYHCTPTQYRQAKGTFDVED
ncbi:MAG: helix-turn-helix domain-containing protein, partial [bacterium]|nr:helix-turn-helix domain-containing protein [bacterium]